MKIVDWNEIKEYAYAESIVMEHVLAEALLNLDFRLRNIDGRLKKLENSSNRSKDIKHEER